MNADRDVKGEINRRHTFVSRILRVRQTSMKRHFVPPSAAYFNSASDLMESILEFGIVQISPCHAMIHLGFLESESIRSMHLFRRSEKAFARREKKEDMNK